MRIGPGDLAGEGLLALRSVTQQGGKLRRVDLILGRRDRSGEADLGHRAVQDLGACLG